MKRITHEALENEFHSIILTYNDTCVASLSECYVDSQLALMAWTLRVTVEAVISMVFGSFLVSMPCRVKMGRSELPLVGSFCCQVEGAIETMRKMGSKRM